MTTRAEDREAQRRRAEALEDAFSDLSGDAALVAIGFKHEKMRALDSPQTHEEIAALADNIAKAFALLVREGFYDRPHDPQHRRAVVVLDQGGINDAAGYIGEGIDEEWANRFEDAAVSGGLSPVEYAVLASIAPFMGDKRERSDDLLRESS